MIEVVDRTVPASRVPSGVPGLDALLGGGVPWHRTILVCGDIGTGKTTFGLQFLTEGAKRDEAGLFVSVDQKLQHVVDDARRFGWDLDGAIGRGLITILEASPFFTTLRSRNGLDARQVCGDLAQQVRRSGATRLVIDGATALAPAKDSGGSVDDFVRSLVASLEDNLDCTTVLTARTSGGLHTLAAGSSVERLTSGVIELRVGSLERAVGRSLLIRKMRGAPSALDPRTFDIVDGRGLVLRESA